MNDTAFIIGSIEVKWYAIILTTGMVLALFLFMFLTAKRNIKKDYTNYLAKSRSVDNEFCLSMFLFAIVFAIIGARFLYLAPRGEISSFFDFREGGLTIIGGVPFGALGVLICCMIYKKSFFRVTDMVAPALLLGQIIGRWGNFVNQELYGMPITTEWLQFFPFAVYIDKPGVMEGFYAANFFYEMVLNTIGMIIALVLMFRLGDRLKAGVVTVGYVFWYTIVRGMLEFVKIGALESSGGIKLVQIVCFICAPIALILLVLLQRGVISFETQKMYNRHFAIPLEPPEYVGSDAEYDAVDINKADNE